MLARNRLFAGLAGAVLLCGVAAVGASFAANEPGGEPGSGQGGGRGMHGMHGMRGRGDDRAARQPLTPEELDARVRERFARLDRNSDGVIDRSEIEALLTERHARGRPGMGPGGGRRGVPGGMMNRFDENHDGKVTKDEFIGTIKRRFAAMDLDNDGKITDADLPPMLRGRDILKGTAADGGFVGGAMAGPGQRGKMGRIIGWLRAADANHDGIVTLDEVTALAEKQFARLDRNHDGVIDQADRDLARKERVDYGVLRFLHRFGADKDGKVTREQFTKVSKERLSRMAAEGGGMGYGGYGRGGRDGGPRQGGWGMGRRGPDGQPPRGQETPPAPPTGEAPRRL